MDPENQLEIARLAQEHGAENLVVVLGAADAEALELATETVTEGDPAYVGPLAGVQLGLPVVHVFEIKDEVDPGVYDAEIGFLELTLDPGPIRATMRRIRGDEARP
jgi:betaine reductase